MKGDINKITKPLIGQGQALCIMTISQIKEQLGVTSLNFFHQLNADGQVSDFIRAWDYELRIEVVMHNDVAELISQNNNTYTLSLQDKGTYTSASGLEYRKYFIVIYSNIPAYKF